MRDDDLADGIADDCEIFDNKFTGRVIHNAADSVFHTSGTIDTKPIETDVDNCLFRDASTRVISSIRQIHERNASMQDDAFNNTDVIVEIPKLPGLLISEGDTFIDLDTDGQPSYQIHSVDNTTLATRFRVGLRVLE